MAISPQESEQRLKMEGSRIDWVSAMRQDAVHFERLFARVRYAALIRTCGSIVGIAVAVGMAVCGLNIAGAMGWRWEFILIAIIAAAIGGGIGEAVARMIWDRGYRSESERLFVLGLRQAKDNESQISSGWFKGESEQRWLRAIVEFGGNDELRSLARTAIRTFDDRLDS